MTLLSPGVETKETTTQTTVVDNSTGRAAMVGKFQWGPVMQITQVTSEPDLVSMFGIPNNATADYFMSAANFLSYGNDLRLVRAINEDTARNSSPIAGNVNFNITAAGSNYAVGDKITVKYSTTVVEDSGKVTKVDTDGKILGAFIPSQKIIAYAKSINQYPALSNSWTAEVVSTGSGISGAISISNIETDSGVILTNTSASSETLKSTVFQDKIKKYGMPAVVAIYPGEIGNQISVEIVSKSEFDKASSVLNSYPFGGTYASTVKAVFGYGPQKDDQYAFIVRRNGELVENFILSTTQGEKDVYGSNIFIDDFFARGGSQYIFATSYQWPTGFSGLISLGGGLASVENITAGDLMQAWDKFADPETIEVDLFIAGAVAGETIQIASTVQKYVLSIADERADCLVLTDPPRSSIVEIGLERAIDNMIDWRRGEGDYTEANLNVSSTYAEIEGNYKYQYDKYNDVNRWVPLSADIAGLCVRTDNVGYPWMSPAGYKRGQILNCIKLAIEPKKSHRDRLYQEGINPVIGSSGNGFVLFGDKTATKVPTPFDRINVRRLFNMLKKNIGGMSKYVLFELNDVFERNAFKTEVSQYLSGIKTLGGIYDFRVVCDESNNPPSVIDRNEFVATFYIKPARSINYIILNFVATPTSQNFDEIIGPA